MRSTRATQDRLTLYGTEFSLYTGKVRSYLRYKGIAHREKLATVGVYRRVIVPKTGVRFIPVVETPQGEVIQDTTEIIDRLEERFPERAVYPPTPRQRLAALLLELYGDEWLLIAAMHYRWSFPRQNAGFLHAEFGKIALPRAPAPVRRIVGRRLATRFARMLPALGITSRTVRAIEAWYESTLEQLDAHFARHAYLFGDRASIGDFGLMGPLYAHLYRDPAPGALMRRRAPNVVRWVERMNRRKPPVGDWLFDDHVPQTLLPILRRQFDEQFPVLRDVVGAVADWVQDHPGERIPRSLGRHRFRLGGVEAQRAILTFPQWMLQRPLGYYASLRGDERDSVDQLLHEAGGYEAMQLQIPQPLERRHNRLCPVPLKG